jgi:hypothetical protein
VSPQGSCAELAGRAKKPGGRESSDTRAASGTTPKSGKRTGST